MTTGKAYASKSICKRKLVAKEDQEDVRREIQIMHHLSGHKNVVAIKGAQYSERKAAELTRVIVSVMHRDLKPENFLLANEDDDSSLKAIYFGLSVFFKTAPEVLGKHYGPEADVWTQACKEHNLTDVLIDEIIGEVDQDNDGRIDFGEFVAVMQKGNMGHWRLTMRSMINSLNMSMRFSRSSLITSLLTTLSCLVPNEIFSREN
ncbi:hypothetical protein ZIOFF_007594 [Zingiber officinale]|uniref:Uncharacterized protein n=1 Tax=Zingiber officinale TaxID=94328 RepID=A0A8J5IGP4_ZINOF|nr:hypothetical protein ZIOFF_007594 [Zingiber officinale]